MHPTLLAVTERLVQRSAPRREAWLARMNAARERGRRRHRHDCSNLAHGLAACRSLDKQALLGPDARNIAMVTAYNDILSAHQPFESYPAILREAVRAAGGVAQVAGGVPAMCDGVTQGTPGMELSLFSRDVIAMSTAVALTHDLFDGVACLGVCDKIVPGLLMGALSFAHLPVAFVPAGPMTSGLSNGDKRRIREAFAKGEVGREALLAAESRAYHGPGTCTFYGTANTNQMLMELMGLHLPGASFVNPGNPLREALTREAGRRLAAGEVPALMDIVDERVIANAVVGLHATGGSTNHTLHLVAMARAAAIDLTWRDLADLSEVVPLLTRVYPNGSADVNAFHSAGGMAFLVKELLDAGLLHEDVQTIMGPGLRQYAAELRLVDGALRPVPAPAQSGDPKILAAAGAPFSPTGGLVVASGNLGQAVMKVSAVKPEHRVVEAPARVFDDQESVQAAFDRGELTSDLVAVVRFQGPRAAGMPELHKLTPLLSILQDRGLRVALVTDGRMSGASGKVLSAIHVSPECVAGGALARVRDGDLLRVDGVAGRLEALVPDLDSRPLATADFTGNATGFGRELFQVFRANASAAEHGASVFG